MTRRDLLKCGAAGMIPAPGAKPPNFLFLLCDQLNLDGLSAHGNPNVRTPNLDRLAARGVSFMESHSTNPVCSPARSSLFTGRMPVETGVITNSRAIDDGIPNTGEWFREHGYETMYCGKWHLPGPPEHARGFTAIPGGRPGEGCLMDPWNSLACETYLRNRSGSQPFVLVSSLLEPHDICFWSIQHKELVPPELPFPSLAGKLPALPPNNKSRPKAPKALENVSWKLFSDDQWRYYLYCYYRQVEMLDGEVGRLLNALEASGEAGNTIVIFTADHGEGAGRHSHVQKWYPYEEAVKVPMIVSCPGRIEQGLRDGKHLVSGVDVMSTMCDYAGIPAPPDARGRSLRPLLENKAAAWREFVAAEVRITGRVIRTADFKYVNFENDPVEQLFDMKNDPWEMKNLYEDPKYADVMAQHRKLLRQWNASLKPTTPTPEALPPRPAAGQRPRDRKAQTQF
jgi:choline-sulfatase